MARTVAPARAGLNAKFTLRIIKRYVPFKSLINPQMRSLALPKRRATATSKAKTTSSSPTSKTADQALWGYLTNPTPAKNLREALTKFEQMANRPDTAGCLFHRFAVQHQDKIVDYLTGLLKPYAIDKKAAAAALLSVIDGTVSTRMLYGTAKHVSILSSAEAILSSFQTASPDPITPEIRKR